MRPKHIYLHRYLYYYYFVQYIRLHSATGINLLESTTLKISIKNESRNTSSVLIQNQGAGRSSYATESPGWPRPSASPPTPTPTSAAPVSPPLPHPHTAHVFPPQQKQSGDVMPLQTRAAAQPVRVRQSIPVAWLMSLRSRVACF